MQGDGAAGKDRHPHIAVDHQVKTSGGANLLLDRKAHRVRVDHPGNGDQAEQRGSEACRNRHPEALYPLGHRQ